jgi:hypothetical protein
MLIIGLIIYIMFAIVAFIIYLSKTYMFKFELVLEDLFMFLLLLIMWWLIPIMILVEWVKYNHRNKL